MSNIIAVLFFVIFIIAPQISSAKLPYRPCMENDLSGIWEVKKTINSFDKTIPYDLHERYYFNPTDKSLKFIQTTSPFDELNIILFDTMPTNNFYQMDENGLIKITNEQTNVITQLLCTYNTQTFEEAGINTGDMLLTKLYNDGKRIQKLVRNICANDFCSELRSK